MSRDGPNQVENVLKLMATVKDALAQGGSPCQSARTVRSFENRTTSLADGIDKSVDTKNLAGGSWPRGRDRYQY